MSEAWKPIPSLPGYEASDMGRIRCWRPWTCDKSNGPRIRKLTERHRGYLYLAVRERGKAVLRAVHHLVLEAFVGPRPTGHLARHLNGNPSDNRPENLAWGTHEENCADAVLHGRLRIGERNARAKLTAAQARAIHASDESQLVLARRYAVSTGTIWAVRTGVRWQSATVQK